MHNDHQRNAGIRYALIAYGSWGLLPLYWKLMKGIPAFNILLHRIIWACIFYTIVRYFLEKKVLSFGLTKKSFAMIFAASVLLAVNWLTYIYAVNSGRVLEASLAYFIAPLISIFVGVTLLNEKLLKRHKQAVALACVGVFIVAYSTHAAPWLSFVIAISFSFYGFFRKKLHLSSVCGAQLETLLLLPAVAVYLALSPDTFFAPTVRENILLISTGAVTAFPLLFFTEAAKRLPYYLMGFFQFLTPTLMFFLGLLYKEPMNYLKFIGFLFIWAASIHLIKRGQVKAPSIAFTPKK